MSMHKCYRYSFGQEKESINKILQSIVPLYAHVDEALNELLDKQVNIEELHLKRLSTQFTQTFQNFKSKKLAHVDLSFSSSLNDRGISFGVYTPLLLIYVYIYILND
jgi:hypothetical protein